MLRAGGQWAAVASCTWARGLYHGRHGEDLRIKMTPPGTAGEVLVVHISLILRFLKPCILLGGVTSESLSYEVPLADFILKNITDVYPPRGKKMSCALCVGSESGCYW